MRCECRAWRGRHPDPRERRARSVDGISRVISRIAEKAAGPSRQAALGAFYATGFAAGHGAHGNGFSSVSLNTKRDTSLNHWPNVGPNFCRNGFGALVIRNQAS